MSNKTAKLISPERVEQLLECYGGNPKSWPDDERATALALIQHSSHLKQLQQEAQHLDHLLVQADSVATAISPQAANVVPNADLVDRIVKNLPEQEKPTRHSGRGGSGTTRRPALLTGNWLSMAAASIAVFVVTFSIVELNSLHSHQPKNAVTQQELNSWMWNQIGSDSDSQDDEPLTVMSFLEM